MQLIHIDMRKKYVDIQLVSFDMSTFLCRQLDKYVDMRKKCVTCNFFMSTCKLFMFMCNFVRLTCEIHLLICNFLLCQHINKFACLHT